MIIKLSNFIENAKKYKKGFTITDVMVGALPCYEVLCLKIPGDGSKYAKFYVTKEERIRMSWKVNPIKEFRDLAYAGRNEGVDAVYQVTLRELGKASLEEWNSEVVDRINYGYTTTHFFLELFRNHLSSFSVQGQKNFLRDYALQNSFMKCPITKQWEYSIYSVSIYLDGKRQNASSAGYKKAKELCDLEEFENKIFLWTKNSMPMYRINGSKPISLFNIIRCDYITECEDCGSLSLGEEICQTCYPGVTVGSLMQSYSSKAESVFSFKQKKEDGKTPLFLGVELELENRTSQNLLATWKKLKDHVIIKHDGSVSGGLEICSAPATISVHKEEFKPFFDVVENIKLEARANCGMHVHVDRSGLTELQIGKILSFMYNKANRPFINKIAGRKDNSYCSLAEEKSFTSGVYYDANTSVDYTHRLRRGASERYSGINLTNGATIEFRIFASTVSYDEFNKNLEFVKSMIDFTKMGAVNVKSLKDFESQEVYTNFVKKNRKEYPNLFKFISELN